MKIKYPITFWINPELDSEKYGFQVVVHKTHRQLMKDWRTNIRNKRRKVRPMAFFRPAEGMTFIKTGELDKGASGQLVFSYDLLDTGTIAHECLHAAIHYMDRLKRCKFRGTSRKAQKNEEMLAIAVDTMTEQIVKRLNKEL